MLNVRRQADIIQRALHSIAEQAALAGTTMSLVFRPESGHDDPVVARLHRLRENLLRTKDDLERTMRMFALECKTCGTPVQWVSGEGFEIGHWEHARGAQHGEPLV